MIIMMIVSVILGVISAQTGIIGGFLSEQSSVITDYSLYMLLLFVGFDIGSDKESIKKLFTADRYAFLLPIGTILGTLIGGAVSSMFIQMPINDSMAISAGFGWYSLSAVIIAKAKGADYGSIAFLSNVFREMISIMLIPFIAKRFDPYVSIAPGGATTMDTTLPIVEKFAGDKAALVAFVHGFVLSGLVPFIVPFLLNIEI